MMYFHNLCVAVDQLANTLLAGYPDETLSSRAYRCKNEKRWCVVMNIINAICCNRKHCAESFKLEVDLPSEYKKSWDKKYD